MFLNTFLVSSCERDERRRRRRGCFAGFARQADAESRQRVRVREKDIGPNINADSITL